MSTYLHKVKYYETDKMGITHHSNYIRWMEEARVDYLDQIGYPFARLEVEGMISPVVSVQCDYKMTSKFDDVIEIETTLIELNPVSFSLQYKMTKKETGDVVSLGKSRHCAVNEAGRPISIKKSFPDFYACMESLLVK